MPLENSKSLSIVIPVFNEINFLYKLFDQIKSYFNSENIEIIVVDDGSHDNSVEQLLAIKSEFPQLRILTHQKCCGQSASIITGVKAAQAGVIVTLDGDGQNDPKDIHKLINIYFKNDDIILVLSLIHI